VAVVGPCAAGKTTLVLALRANGWDARQPAQEHSGVPDMWRRLTAPDVLVYLDASLETIRSHRPRAHASAAWLAELERRLAHARAHADLVHSVDGESAGETLEAVERFLRRWQARGGGPERKSFDRSA
jgi:hypothetical protein